MDPHDLLTRCYRAGVQVSLRVDGLRLKRTPCPADLKAELMAHKPSVIATLTTHGIGGPSPDPSILAPLAYVVPCQNSMCPILGPCPSVLSGEPCPLVDAMEDVT